MLPALALLLACRPEGPRVASVEHLGPIEQSADIQGRDGGLSARLWDRSVWVYGDTVLNVEDEDGVNWHHNSVSWTGDLDASDGLEGFEEPLDSVGAPAHLIPPSDQEQAFNLAHWGEECEVEPCGARWAVWPGQPTWDEQGQRALVFYGLIYAEPGDFNFESVGGSIATWTDPQGLPQRPVIDADAEHPDLIWGQGEPGWGVGTALHDGWLYTFACDSDGLEHRCKLGRAARDQVLERSAWQVWTGQEWSSEQDRAKALFTGGSIMSLSWNTWLDAWLVVYSRPFSEEVVARTAPELTGPWSRESVLYTDDSAPYDAVAHAEYEEEEGRVITVSHSRPTGETWFSTELPLTRVTFE